MKLLKSFGYAFRGIYTCLRLERNFRIHITAVITVLVFAQLYDLPPDKYPPLLLCMMLVMALEAINTAIERVVNLATHEHCPLARIAKDVAAAAVLVAALGAVAIAVLTFSDIEKLLGVISLFQSPMPILGLILYILFFWGFVFLFPNKIQTKEETI